MIEKISTHSFTYCNFTITKLPAKTINPITRYNVQHDGCSYGLFDSLNDAAQYIDKLYAMRGTHPCIDDFVFNRTEKIK
ncbi:hypothetical protein EA147_16330 [Providencia stuartii]|nr:hypothetical protein EA147_16330 [Providencia stuartii]